MTLPRGRDRHEVEGAERVNYTPTVRIAPDSEIGGLGPAEGKLPPHRRGPSAMWVADILAGFLWIAEDLAHLLS